MTLRPYSSGDEGFLGKTPENKGDHPAKSTDKSAAPPAKVFKKGASSRAEKTSPTEKQERTHRSVGDFFRSLKTGDVKNAKDIKIGLGHMHTYIGETDEMERTDSGQIADGDVIMSQDPNQINANDEPTATTTAPATVGKKESKTEGRLGRFQSLFKGSIASMQSPEETVPKQDLGKTHRNERSKSAKPAPLAFQSIRGPGATEKDEEADASVSEESVAESSPIDMDASKRSELAMEKQANGAFTARGKGAGEWPIVVSLTTKGKENVFEVKLQKSAVESKTMRMALLGKPAMLKVLFPKEDTETLHALHAVLLSLQDQAGSLPPKEKDELSKALEAIKEYVKNS